ncbi:MAG: hypothetical protein K6G16_08280 [Lachnospiraceae bacterium]|nr:hypothetical protein [Lachnospiraceae bacterium]
MHSDRLLSVRVTSCRTARFHDLGEPADTPGSPELYLDFSFPGNADEITAAEPAGGDVCTDSGVDVPVFAHRDGVYIRVTESGGRLRAPLIRTQLKHFYPDIANYSYLPAEDMAIHNSVAQFVDRTHRLKATKENCYVRREGLFVPVPVKRRRNRPESAPDLSAADSFTEKEPLFQTDARDKRRFMEYTKEKDMNAWLVHVLVTLLF